MLKPFLRNAHVGTGMKHPDPRSQRTGVAFTVSMASEKVLGLSEEMQPTLMPLCIDSIPFYRCLLSFVFFGIATLRIIETKDFTPLNRQGRKRVTCYPTYHISLACILTPDQNNVRAEEPPADLRVVT